MDNSFIETILPCHTLMIVCSDWHKRMLLQRMFWKHCCVLTPTSVQNAIAMLKIGYKVDKVLLYSDCCLTEQQEKQLDNFFKKENIVKIGEDFL